MQHEALPQLQPSSVAQRALHATKQVVHVLELWELGQVITPKA